MKTSDRTGAFRGRVEYFCADQYGFQVKAFDEISKRVAKKSIEWKRKSSIFCTSLSGWDHRNNYFAEDG